MQFGEFAKQIQVYVTNHYFTCITYFIGVPFFILVQTSFLFNKKHEKTYEYSLQTKHFLVESQNPVETFNAET